MNTGTVGTPSRGASHDRLPHVPTNIRAPAMMRVCTARLVRGSSRPLDTRHARAGRETHVGVVVETQAGIELHDRKPLAQSIAHRAQLHADGRLVGQRSGAVELHGDILGGKRQRHRDVRRLDSRVARVALDEAQRFLP